MRDDAASRTWWILTPTGLELFFGASFRNLGNPVDSGNCLKQVLQDGQDKDKVA